MFQQVDSEGVGEHLLLLVDVEEVGPEEWYNSLGDLSMTRMVSNREDWLPPHLSDMARIMANLPGSPLTTMVILVEVWG